MIVRFHLHADVVVAIESDDTRIIAKHAHAPVACAERLSYLLCGGKYGLLEKVVVLALAVGPRMVHRTAKRLVAAVLAPGLCNGLQFDLKRLSSNRLKMVSHGSEFAGRQCEASRSAEMLKRRIVKAVERHRRLRKNPFSGPSQRCELQWPNHHIVNGLAGKQLPSQPLGIDRMQWRQPILANAAHMGWLQAEKGHRLLGAFGRRIGDASSREHVHDSGQFGWPRHELLLANCGNDKGLGDRIGQ